MVFVSTCVTVAVAILAVISLTSSDGLTNFVMNIIIYCATVYVSGIRTSHCDQNESVSSMRIQHKRVTMTRAVSLTDIKDNDGEKQRSKQLIIIVEVQPPSFVAVRCEVMKQEERA